MERSILPSLQRIISPFLSPFQAGFRSGYSTIDQIYYLTRSIQRILSTSSHSASVPVAFLDLSKAFDRVWVDGLLFKMLKCGVVGELWWWLKSFLSNRSICVSSQGMLSSPRAITAGVPQGSVLSPTLFLIFINDITNCCVCSHIGLFADDLTIWPKEPIEPNKHQFIEELHLRNTLYFINQWAADWRMTFNVKKSCVVLFERIKKARQNSATNRPAQHPVTFSLGNEELPQRDSARYLGVVLHKYLNWDEHFNYILPKIRYVARRICHIIRIGQPPTLPSICELIKTQLHPIIAYGFPIVRYTKEQEQQIDSIIARIIKRSCSVFVTTYNAASFINDRVLDTASL
jgi:hypothetical protein